MAWAPGTNMSQDAGPGLLRCWVMHTSAGLYGTSLVKQLVVMALPHFGIACTNYTTEEYLKLTYQLFFQVEVSTHQLNLSTLPGPRPILPGVTKHSAAGVEATCSQFALVPRITAACPASCWCAFLSPPAQEEGCKPCYLAGRWLSTSCKPHTLVH
jgi:hypothetical protein